MKSKTQIKIDSISEILLKFKRTIYNIQNVNELAQRICSIAVNELGYNFAWFGLSDPANKSISLLAQYGEASLFEKNIILTLDDDINHPAISAIKNCSPAIDFSYPNNRQGKTIALPIMNTTHALGVFCASFDQSVKNVSEEDINILEDIMRDCSYCIHNIQLKAENDTLRHKIFDFEKQFQSIFENSVVPMGLIALDGKFNKVNKALCHALGYNEKELLNKTVFELSFPDDIKKYSTETELLFKGQLNSIHLIKRYVCKNEDVLWADVTGSLVKDIDGNPIFISFVAQNITAKVLSYNNLKASEEKYKKFFDNDLSGNFVTSLSGKIKLCNPAFLQILGYGSIDELTGKNVSEIYYDPHDRGMLINELKLNNTLVWYENNLRHKNGSKITVLENAFANYDSDGNITDIQGYIFDITEKRKAEKNIQLLTKAVEQSPASIVITDPNGNIEYVNPKFTDLTGYTFEEVINRNPSILKSGQTTTDEYKKLWDTILAGNEWRGEFKNINKKGEYYWESAVISPIRDLNGEIINFVAVKEDISDRKKMLDELIIAKEAAEISDMLKSEFLDQMSHEIRTPLTIVLSNTDYIKEIIEEKDIQDDELITAFKHVEIGGKRIIRTIELILAMSELEAGSFNNRRETINIYSKIVERLYDEFKSIAIDSKLQLVLLKNTGNTFSKVDKRAAYMILYHLIDNAIKFTSKGGVTISVDSNSDSLLSISVEDTGIGMSQEYMKDIFKLFSQEDHGYSRQYDGNGLGLALTKRLCDLNNIIISVKSEKGKGSIFTLTFPQ